MALGFSPVGCPSREIVQPDGELARSRLVRPMSPEALFRQYRDFGDAEALGAVFDRLAPELALIAAHLVGADAAEDLVQATFLDAIEQRDRWDGSRPLAPWLVGLLGMHVRRARRERGRSPDAGRLGHRGSDVDDRDGPAAAAVSRDTLALVRRTVAQLPPHYRTVLSLRLVDGLEVQAIARSLGVPLGTVKARLHRGLDLLRRTLPAGVAGAVAALGLAEPALGAVRAAVVDAAMRPGVGAGAGGAVGTGVGTLAVTGAWIMKQWIIGSAIVLVVFAGWLVVRSDAPEPGQTEAGSASPVGAVAAAPGEQSSSAAPVAAPATVERSIVPAATPRSRLGALRVAVVWRSDGAPVAGVQVELYRQGLRRAVRVVRTPDDGVARFADLPPGDYRASILALPHAPCEMQVEAGDEVERDLPVRGDARLRVMVTADDGVPWPGALVWALDHLGGPRGGRVLGRTDAAGVLEYRGLPPATVWARADGREPSRLHALPGDLARRSRSAPHELSLVLGGAAAAVHGVVTDPDGRTVPGATVAVAVVDEFGAVDDPVEVTTTTDAAGRFALTEVPVGERNIVAIAPGFAVIEARVETKAQEVAFVELQLRRGASVRGTVLDAGGQPAAFVLVTAGTDGGPIGIQHHGGQVQTARTDAAGRYRIDGIAPGSGRILIHVSPISKRAFTFVDGETHVFDVRPAPRAAIRGVLTDDAGKPLACWTVAAARHTFEAMPVSGLTDRGGRFELAVPAAHEFRLLVFAPNQGHTTPLSSRPRLVVSGVRPGAEPLQLEVPESAMGDAVLRGRVALPGDIDRVVLVLRGVVAGSAADVFDRVTVRAGDDPAFRFAPLPPGRYRIVGEFGRRGRVERDDIVLRAGEDHELAPLALGRRHEVRLRLLHRDGSAVKGANLRLDPGWVPFTEPRPGEYESPAVQPGQFEVSAFGPGIAPARFRVDVVDDTPIERTLAPAATVEFVMTPPSERQAWRGTLAIELRTADPRPLLQAIVTLPGEPNYTWSTGLLPGTYTLTVRGNQGTAKRTVTVGAGAQRFDVPLR